MRRDYKAITYIEQEFGELLESLAQKQAQTPSSLIRSIIIQDLIRRGLVNTETMTRVLTEMS